MVQALKNRMKNEKGFTLIELLAVIVILGILAAIAIPSVLGIIDNSKKDAHVANAQQMISSAKMAVANNPTLQSSGIKILPLEYLENSGYLETIKDPDGGTYLRGTGDNTIDTLPATEPNTQVSYVVVSSGTVTKVKLVNSSRGIQVSGTKASVDVTTHTLDRSDVN